MTTDFGGKIIYPDTEGVWSVNGGHVSSRSGARRAKYGTLYVIPFIKQLYIDGLISGGEEIIVND